ncbi:MAG TPA: 50S ribosomal protein L24 [Chloroflexi bacterium]|nr:50S ribosomal protein L24 [Chloroflexota bacterium]
MAKIKRGDTVEVVSGEDRTFRGEVKRVLPKADRIVVSTVNVVKKHQRPVRAGQSQVQAGIIEFEAPIDISNVMLVCPSCDQRTRAGFTFVDGRKVRVCKQCGDLID